MLAFLDIQLKSKPSSMWYQVMEGWKMARSSIWTHYLHPKNISNTSLCYNSPLHGSIEGNRRRIKTHPSLKDCSPLRSLHKNSLANTHPPADTRCQPNWLPVRRSHTPRQVPFITKNHFLHHVRYGDINKCTMTVLREESSYPASANLPTGHFGTTGKRNCGNKQVQVRNSSPLAD